MDEFNCLFEPAYTEKWKNKHFITAIHNVNRY